MTYKFENFSFLYKQISFSTFLQQIPHMDMGSVPSCGGTLYIIKQLQNITHMVPMLFTIKIISCFEHHSYL